MCLLCGCLMHACRLHQQVGLIAGSASVGFPVHVWLLMLPWTSPLSRPPAAPVVEGLAELLGADAAVQQLLAHVQAAAERWGVQSPATQAALDSSLYLLTGMSGLLETCCINRVAGEPLPAWLLGAKQRGAAGCTDGGTDVCMCSRGGLLVMLVVLLLFNCLHAQLLATSLVAGLMRLFGMAPEAACAGSPAGLLLTILHADLLGCWCQVGALVMPLLQTQHQQVGTKAWWARTGLEGMHGQPLEVQDASTQLHMRSAAACGNHRLAHAVSNLACSLQDMQQLVLGQALCALSNCSRTADVGAGSTDDVIERAANALRVLCR